MNDNMTKEQLQHDFNNYKQFLIELCYVLQRNNIDLIFKEDDSDVNY